MAFLCKKKSGSKNDEIFKQYFIQQVREYLIYTHTKYLFSSSFYVIWHVFN